MTPSQTSPTFCKHLWRHLCIDARHYLVPCCRFETPDEEAVVDGTVANLESLFNKSSFQEIRAQMLEGKKVFGCQKCYREEATGFESLRQFANRVFTEPVDPSRQGSLDQVEFLEIFVGNECNLKCISCGPHFSTAWYEDAEKMKIPIYPQKNLAWDYKELLLRMPALKIIKFVGGEPFYSKLHDQILASIPEERAANMVLIYFTNTTISPSTELKATWSRFSHLRLHLSIDGVGALNEYLRFPSKWNQVERVAHEFFDFSTRHRSCAVNVNATISAYNIFNINALAQWYEQLRGAYELKEESQLSLTPLSMPEILSPLVLPEELREQAVTRLNQQDPRQANLARYLALRGRKDRLPQFVSYTQALDKIRGQNVTQAVPELSTIFTERLEF